MLHRCIVNRYIVELLMFEKDWEWEVWLLFRIELIRKARHGESVPWRTGTQEARIHLIRNSLIAHHVRRNPRSFFRIQIYPRELRVLRDENEACSLGVWSLCITAFETHAKRKRFANQKLNKSPGGKVERLTISRL